MTDRELADQAEQHLKKTTVVYQEWKRRVDQGKYTPKDGSGTEWGKAFAALDQIDQGEPQQPDPAFPPSWADFSDDFDPAPASRWAWEFAGSTVGFPNAGAKLIGTEPGVRLSSPVVGGNGQLSAFYDGSGTWGKNGMRQQGTIDIRLIAQSAFIWVWEWHENQNWIDINSCAVGVNPDRSLRVQISGGQVANHQYTHLTVQAGLQLNRWYTLGWDITWSPDPNVGRFVLTLDGQGVVDQRRGTLLASCTSTDTTVIGGYCYTPPGSSGTHVVDFRKFAVGV